MLQFYIKGLHGNEELGFAVVTGMELQGMPLGRSQRVAIGICIVIVISIFMRVAASLQSFAYV